ncbi:hypothetical protein D3C76_1132680 [compost metagenome]
MTHAMRNLFTAPVKQGAEEQHQGTVHHKVADIGRLGDKPGGRRADVRTHFRHDCAAAHLQQAMPAAVQLCADQWNAVEPRQIRHGHLTAGYPADHRAAGIDQAVNQQRNRNNKD